MTPIEALNSAIAKADGVFAFCRKLNLTHQAIYNWKRRGSVPLERAIEIERLYGVPATSLVKPSIAGALVSAAAGSVL